MEKGKIYIIKIIDEITENEIVEEKPTTEKNLKVSNSKLKFLKRKPLPTETILKVVGK